jgi:hypothetical protein
MVRNFSHVGPLLSKILSVLIHFSPFSVFIYAESNFLTIIKNCNFYFVLPRPVCDPPFDLRPTHSSPQKTVGFFLLEFNPSIHRHGGICWAADKAVLDQVHKKVFVLRKCICIIKITLQRSGHI